MARLKIEDLPEEVLAKLGIMNGDKKALNNRVIVLSMVIRDIGGLDGVDALWVLKKVRELIIGVREKRLTDSKNGGDENNGS